MSQIRQDLIEKYGVTLTVVQVAEVLKCSTSKIYKGAGPAPVRGRRKGDTLLWTLDVVVEWLLGDTTQGIQVVEKKEDFFNTTYPSRRGAPTKKERLEARKFGISVKDLRAKSAESLPRKSQRHVGQGEKEGA